MDFVITGRDGVILKQPFCRWLASCPASEAEDGEGRRQEYCLKA